MSKPLAASKKLMQTYLSELLTEEPTAKVIESSVVERSAEGQKLEKLLEKVNVASQHDETAPAKIVSKKSQDTIVTKKVIKPVVIEPEPVEEPVLATKKSKGEIPSNTEKGYRKGSFQALFFDVAGLIIAVPLVELGGIHNLDKTNSLMGKPAWFKGVMIHREDRINVVDTALWVMPEKCDDKLKASLNYQYLIMLSNSPWGLMAERLVDTVTLEQEDVKWLDGPSKRPWLAGLVKDKMCALLDVNSMIELLDDGASIISK